MGFAVGAVRDVIVSGERVRPEAAEGDHRSGGISGPDERRPPVGGDTVHGVIPTDSWIVQQIPISNDIPQR